MSTESVDWRDLPPVPEDQLPEFGPDFIPSQTFLRTMDRCDYAAMLYRKYRAGAGGHELNRGAIFHETIERLERLMVEQGEPEMAPEIGRDVLYETMHDNPAMQVRAEERDNLRYMVDHWCRGTRFDPTKVIGIEKTITLEIGGFRVLVRPDLMLNPGEGICEVVDYKTAWPPDSEEFRRQAFDRHGRPRWAGNYQLNMSAVVMAFGVDVDGMALGNFERYRLRLAYPRILREINPGEYELEEHTVEVDALQVQNFRDDLELQLKRLEEVCLGERRWQPTPGNHCRECPCEYECPLPPLLRPESQHADLGDMEALEKAATASNFMASRATNLKGRVKKAALRLEEQDPTVLTLPDGRRGVMCGTDLAYIFEPYERTEIEADNLAAAAQAALDYGDRFDPEEHKKVSTGVKFEKRKVGS